VQYAYAADDDWLAVQMKNVVIGLIERLATYTACSGSAAAVLEQVPLFDVFSEQVTKIVNSRHDMPAEHVVALQVSSTCQACAARMQTALLNLALKCYPQRADYADTVFAGTAQVFDKMRLNKYTAFAL
jgi:vacuolar protein sorting-associated protein 35